ncbi:glutamate--tRNA ligase [Rickettsiales bacterium]|nr:glutamate--tRNA ligase [Rickettsiales bacterium]
MTVITRFAPSPTGHIHIGNVRTALLCYLVAKSNSGQFMLRLDDTDKERSKTEYADQIKKDLQWLGLNWDLTAKQSDRFDRYNQIKQKLIDDGRLYPCYETEEELDVMRKMLLGRGLPPIYDRGALKLSDEQKKQYESEGRSAHWRFKLDDSKPIEWNDLVKGPQKFDPANLSDPILIRQNGLYTYMLPSAIDDMDFNISHVVRGEDHVSNTAIQIQLFEAIGDHMPIFAHHSLMKSKDGKISKREGGFDVGSLKESGIEPMAITSLMARLGTSDPVEPRSSIEEIIENFDLSKFSRAAAIYDVSELERVNAKIVHMLEYDQIKSRDSMSGIDENFWNSVKYNIGNINEIQAWKEICLDELSPIVAKENEDFLKEAADLLPQGEWNVETWSKWIEKIKEKTGRKGKDLFMPLRLALTAQEHGPELKNILPLIGRQKTLQRLGAS